MWRAWRTVVRVVVGVVDAGAATVLAAAVNVATGGTSPWLPPVAAHPLWWTVGATAAVAGSGVLVWRVERWIDQRLAALVPAEQRPDSWVVARPEEVGKVVAALRDRGRGTVGVTTAVQGAGGFGKTTVAKLVRADRRVLRYFDGRVYWVTLGRDARTKAAIAEKVNDLLTRLDPDRAATFTDPQQAGEQLAAVLASRPRTLLVLDDVWYPEQETAFPLGGKHSARLITTRVPSLLDRCVPIRVDEVTAEQARMILTAGLPSLPAPAAAALLAETGRWPLLLRLVNKILADQLRTSADVGAVAQDLVERLRRSGPLQVDELTGVTRQPLDVNDPVRRQLAITATIEASSDLLTPADRERFAELAVFVEDETIPVPLTGQLWQVTGNLDLMASRALCARLDDLALLTLTSTTGGGVVSLHDVIRDYLHEKLGRQRLVELHETLLDTVAAGLTTAPAPTDGMATTAWWELDESARYLWDHLIEHFIAAERRAAAEVLVTDLRWVAARLEQTSPTAPFGDLAHVTTALCTRLRRLLGQTAHLLAPTDPAHSRVDILYARVEHDPHWQGQVNALVPLRAVPRLVNQSPLPDLPDPALRLTLVCDQLWINAVAISPDGTWVATAGENTAVQAWDVATGVPKTVLADGHGIVGAMAIAPDNTWLAIAGYSSTVRIMDASGAERAVLASHGEWVRSVMISPDGTWLTTVNSDTTVQIWDAATGAERAVLTGHRDRVRSVAIAPDGTWLVTLDLNRTVRIWDAATGAHKATFTGEGVGNTMEIAPDGTWLATGGFDGLRVWDMATGKPRTKLLGHRDSVTAMAIAPNGAYLASVSDDRTLRIWDVVEGRAEAVMRVDQDLHACRWTSDGKGILVGGSKGFCQFGFLP
jgi:hypothetical protein